jgi:hypothetical protein
VPPNNGTVTVGFSGAASAGSAGGRTVDFSSFTPNTTWSRLYWGRSSLASATAGLDGTQHVLTFASFTGTTATWNGTTSWTNPANGTVHSSVPLRMTITVTGLGANPWVTSTSVPSLDPGPGTGIGAVVNNSSLVNFSANVQFLADIPTDGSGNFIALNDVPVLAGQTNSSFTGGFYSATP